MAKKNSTLENKNNIEVTNIIKNKDVETIDIQPEIIEKYKEEYCKILWIGDRNFAFDFKGFGLTIPKTEHLLDKSLIKDFIKIKYISDIYEDDFKFYAVYE
jgi:hypothetical protein